MKKSIFLILFSLFFISQTKACVETHPDSIWVAAWVDSTNCDLIIQVANLNMFGGSPNEFCSCGINDQISNVGQIEYVVFVDAATLTPLIGFDQYELNALTGESWENYDTEASYNWSGFIAIVNDAGLVAGQEVILWIRMTDVGDSSWWAEFDEDCGDEDALKSILDWTDVSFGTDMWDPITEELSDSHLSISKLIEDDNGWEFSHVSAEFIAEIDMMVEDFYNGIESYTELNLVHLFPNPTNDLVTITNLPNSIQRIEIYDIQGRYIDVLNPASKIDLSFLNDGVYAIHLIGNNERIVKRIIKK